MDSAAPHIDQSARKICAIPAEVSSCKIISMGEIKIEPIEAENNADGEAEDRTLLHLRDRSDAEPSDLE